MIMRVAVWLGHNKRRKKKVPMMGFEPASKALELQSSVTLP